MISLITDFFKKYIINILIGYCIIVSIIAGVYYIESNKLKSENYVLNVLKDKFKAEQEELRNSLVSLSESIKQNEIDSKNKELEYNENMKKIRQEFKNKEVKSDDCKDIKTELDNIRTNGYYWLQQ